MKKLAIFGSGGFGVEIYFLVQNIISNKKDVNYKFIGFFDDKEVITPFGAYLGGIQQLNEYPEELHVLIGIGNAKALKHIRCMISNKNIFFPNIIHPSCTFISKETLTLGEGNIFLTGCTVSCNVNIGNFNIFNSNVTLGHDVKVENYNVFSPNVIISGNVSIGNENLLGFNSGIIQGKKIGNRNVIGAGSSLIRNIKDDGTYIGVPAQKIKI